MNLAHIPLHEEVKNPRSIWGSGTAYESEPDS